MNATQVDFLINIFKKSAIKGFPLTSNYQGFA